MIQTKHHSGLPIFVISGLCLIVINVFFPPEKPYAQSFESSDEQIVCTLERILDGDTLTAYCAERYLAIRLAGIDAPELGQIPWGEQSQQALQTLMTPQFMLRPQGKDIYERQLGTVFVQGQDVNLTMIIQGYAVAYRGEDTPAHYMSSEKTSRNQGIGIWEKAGGQQNPSRWRREHQK